MKRPIYKKPVHKPLRRYDVGGRIDTSIPPITPVNTPSVYTPRASSTSHDYGKDLKNLGQGLSDVADATKKSGGNGTTPTEYTGNYSGSLDTGQRKGGPIRKTYGPKIGKEDGIIAAQKGEYVVRKSAVKKLGKKALDTVNKGRLPNRMKSQGK